MHGLYATIWLILVISISASDCLADAHRDVVIKPERNTPWAICDYNPTSGADTPRVSDSPLLKGDIDNDLHFLIESVQLSLQYQGFYDGPVDGFLSWQTSRAVALFKKARGIADPKRVDVDSDIDDATIQALCIK